MITGIRSFFFSWFGKGFLLLAVHGILGIGLFGQEIGQEWIRHTGDVIHHFQEHRQADPSLDLVGFMRLHFWDLRALHQKDHDHSRLPFQHEHSGLCLTVHVMLPHPVVPVMEEDLPSYHCRPVIPEGHFRKFRKAEDIWQPPKAS